MTTTAASFQEHLPKRVAFAVRQFGLDRKRVLDVGSGDGTHLVHFGPGSIGLELQDAAIARARARGLEVRQWNFTHGFPADLAAGFDAVWCSALLEHVLSPHGLLVQARAMLRPAGLFLGIVPMTRRAAIGPWRGFLAADHVGFFTPRTLRLTVERAGYEIVFLGTPSVPRAPRRVAAALQSLSPNAIVAGRIVEGFDYPAKAHKRLVNNEIVYRR